jgi:hypothetical protein
MFWKVSKMENLGKHLQGGLAFTENDVVSHATDIFRPIAKEISMKDSNLIIIRPVSMNQGGPYAFQITQRGAQYVQMNNIRLYMQAKVVASNDAVITDAEGVGVINLLGNSLFKTIEIEIGGKLIPELQNTHSNYKAYLETLLSYSHEARSSHLKASRWVIDDPDFDDVKYHATHDNTENTTNVGYRERRTYIKGSKVFDMMLPLHSDFLNCDRLLPPGVQMTVKLTRESDSFVMMTKDDAKTYKIVLSEMKLFVPYITVAENIASHHMSQIQSKPCILPMKKTDIITHHIGAGGVNVYLPNLFQNRMPKTLIVGMVATPSYNGKQTTNPYNFKHFGVNYVSIIRNGTMIPSEPYTPDWDAKLYMREYRSFCDNIGIGTDNLGIGITPEMYAGGCTLFAFDLTPDRCNGKLVNLVG